jgi:hypothetical protein
LLPFSSEPSLFSSAVYKRKNITYKTIILPVVLCGWSLTLREEHGFKASENRVLMRIFGPKSDEILGGWRKLYNEELHGLYSSPNKIRMIKEDEKSRARSTHGENRHAYRILVGKSEGTRPFGRT